MRPRQQNRRENAHHPEGPLADLLDDPQPAPRKLPQSAEVLPGRAAPGRGVQQGGTDRGPVERRRPRLLAAPGGGALLLFLLLLLLLVALSSGGAAALPGLIGGGVHEHCRRRQRRCLARRRVFEWVTRRLQRRKVLVLLRQQISLYFVADAFHVWVATATSDR